MKKYVVRVTLFFVVAALSLGFGTACQVQKENPEPLTKETENVKMTEEEIQTEALPTQTEEEKEAYSKTPLMKGIDVSKWQGKPDWKKIAADGVEFAMIRIGYHGTMGPLGEDDSADYNLKSADENGILTGVYFYSLAKNIQEAEEEAEWVLERAGKYAISLPVVIDYEMMDNDATASASERTDIALAFLEKVRDAGYDAMIYVPIQELNDEVFGVGNLCIDENGSVFLHSAYPEFLFNRF